MTPENVITSPHRRSQPQTAFSPPSPTMKKQHPRGDESGTCATTLIQRHRFLLTALALLAFLCTIYLYFAVTLSSGDPCDGLTGAQKATCHIRISKETVANGKMKFF